MHFADELADTEKLHVPKKAEVGKREMNMTKSLIDSMSSKWEPEKYKDDYREALMEVIEEKVEAGGQEIEEKPKKAPKPTKVIDLVSVLQKSLEQTGAKKRPQQNRVGKKHSLRRKQRSCPMFSLGSARHSRAGAGVSSGRTFLSNREIIAKG
jgi:DNA end-binding protein Ku